MKQHAKITVKGLRKDLIQLAQQIAWISTAFRVPKEGRLARSEFRLCATNISSVFDLKLLPLKDVSMNSSTCWHPLFANGVLAHDFPIPPRNGEVGVELPFEAMIQLAGVIGPVEYRCGLVLKGYSTMIFPKSIPSVSPKSKQRSTQWHLIYQENDLVMLSSMIEHENRVLCSMESLDSLAHSRTFLGCYKEVDIHLGTPTVAYDRIHSSGAITLGRKPELSSFTLGFSLPKFGGPSASMSFTLSKRLSLARKEDSYEQVLSHCSNMPMILYDTCDRRAWMVPALGVILHMIHIWASLQKKQFPNLNLPELPYTNAQWDIGREAQEVIYKNSDLELYISKDGGEPYHLKDLVKKYWLELERVIAVRQDHKVSENGTLIGWELMEIIDGDPFSELKKPSSKKFKGNWASLTSNPNMVVLFCQGLGDIIIPKAHVQKVCQRWKSVPEGNDYLTAATNCVLQCSRRFFSHTVFWECGDEDAAFADCLHDARQSCQRVHQLVKRRGAPLAIGGLESKGAMVFGRRG